MQNLENVSRMEVSETQTSRDALNFGKIISFALVHLFAISAFFYYPTVGDVVLFVCLYLITGMGITIGYHRLLTHRGFDCSYPVKLFWSVCGAAALEGGPTSWVGIHRKHHSTSDQENDPHSPYLGFFHAHIGWAFYRADLLRTSLLARDIAGDKFLRLLDKLPFSLIPWLFTLLVCYLVDGYRGLLWGGAVRTVAVWHATWSVNSFCHIWGRRRYKTNDESRNLWWVAILALGEGWHNNHHHSPRSAIHGHKWYEVDISGVIIRAMLKVGLVRNMVKVKNKK